MCQGGIRRPQPGEEGGGKNDGGEWGRRREPKDEAGRISGLWERMGSVSG